MLVCSDLIIFIKFSDVPGTIRLTILLPLTLNLLNELKALLPFNVLVVIFVTLPDTFKFVCVKPSVLIC